MKNSALIADLLRTGLDVRFKASGTSMLPAISPGENVTASPAGAADVHEGDIVLYMADGRLRAHRLIAVEKDSQGRPSFIMRGDNLRTCDWPVSGAAILGKLVCVERFWFKVPLTAPTYAPELHAEAA